MSEADRLRQRAESLLAMALKAREQGQFDYADTLVAEAAQFISDADALETADRRSRQSHEPARRQQPDDSVKKH